jgi:hypothetical protein
MKLEDRRCKHPDCTNWFRVLPKDNQEYCCKLCGLHNNDEKYIKHHTKKQNFLKIKYGAPNGIRKTKSD